MRQWRASSTPRKVELVHQRRRAPRDEAQRDLFASVEGYYSRQRILSALGYLTPEQAGRRTAGQPRPPKQRKIIQRSIAETNTNPKLFIWTADPDRIIPAARRRHQV